MLIDVNEKNYDEAIDFIIHMSNDLHDASILKKDLDRLIECLRNNKEELAIRQSNENGKPIKAALSEVERCIFLVECGIKILTEGYEKKMTSIYNGQEYVAYEKYIPRGKVLAFTTVSSPYSSVIHKMVAALIYGNNFIYKPSPKVDLCTSFLQALIDEAFSNVTNRRICCIIIKDMKLVKKILYSNFFDCFLFTGKSESAKQIKKIIGRIPAVFETGSNALAYVGDIEEQQMEAVAKQLIRAAYNQSGMRCIGLKNVFINEQIYEKFQSFLIDEFKKIEIGNPMDVETDVGPIVWEKERKAICEEVNRLLDTGYEVLEKKTVEGVMYISPMLLFQGKSSEPSIREIFGPVLCVHIVKDVFNIETNYLKRSSLNSSIYSNKRSEIDEFINRARYSGNICINFGPHIRLDELPFGGYEDENENKEGIEELRRVLTRQQLVIWEGK